MPEKPSEMQNKLISQKKWRTTHSKNQQQSARTFTAVHRISLGGFRARECTSGRPNSACVGLFGNTHTHAKQAVRPAGVGAASNKRKKPLLGPLLSNAAGYVIATITAVRSQSEAAGKGGQIGQTALLLRRVWGASASERERRASLSVKTTFCARSTPSATASECMCSTFTAVKQQPLRVSSFLGPGWLAG